MKTDADHYNRYLWTSGCGLQWLKNKFCLTDYVWKQNKWEQGTIKETPGNLILKDYETGEIRPCLRKQLSQAHKNLGILMDLAAKSTAQCDALVNTMTAMTQAILAANPSQK